MRWEAVVQRVLCIGLPGAMEGRILVYQSQNRPGRQTRVYLEIDHVLGSPTAPELFVEKKSVNCRKKAKLVGLNWSGPWGSTEHNGPESKVYA